MQIGKRQGLSRWHRAGWEEVGRRLLERFGAVVILSGPAPHEVEDAAWLQERLGPRALSTQGRADWPQVAGLLYRARLYVGLDTGGDAPGGGVPMPGGGVVRADDRGELASVARTVPDRHQPRLRFRPPISRSRLAAARLRSMEQIAPEEVIAACDELAEGHKSGLESGQ